MANWFYLTGSICFAVGTVLNMLPSSKPLRVGDFGQYRVMTPEEAARSLVPLTQNNANQ